MDGHFHSGDRFSGPGDAFHRHSHSTANPLAFNFSSMMHSQLDPDHHSQQQQQQQHQSGGSTGTNAYESHDDLCVDRCAGVGLYNGFQQFNHRGGPASIQSHWARGERSLDYHHHDFSMGLGALSMQQFRDAAGLGHHNNLYHHQQPGDAAAAAAAAWYCHPMDSSCLPDSCAPDSCIPCVDEDCRSRADSCCDSECTMTDKCTDVACADTEDACTDQTCPERPAVSLPTSEVVSGAAALISINHAPDGSPADHFDLQQRVMDDLDFSLSNPTSQQPFMLPPDILPGQLGSLTSHLLVAHGDTASSSHCTEPCPLDDPEIYQYCHMPLLNHTVNPFGQFNPVGADFQMNRGFVECGAEIHDAESFLAHFNAQHRQYFTSNTPTHFRPSVPPGPIPSPSQQQQIMPSTEVISSPTTPLDTSDSGRSSGTPSPFTPLSNSIDMTDAAAAAKPDPPLHLRGTSISSSSAGHSLDPNAEEEHRCLWREEGCSAICGLLFADAEELFKHASETHIKHAQKGAQGFRCGWDDCPRAEAGAAGFPQRSKIERHMQTHIGHKPHICPTCNKGFSAKQALTQHMFIHSNEKPLVCNICHKAFRYPSALTMHQRVHSGLKPLKCPICGKGFSESSNLSKHKRTHEVKGRFTCTAAGCERNFHRQDQLRRHMKTHSSTQQGLGLTSGHTFWPVERGHPKK
ncbi:uncharacterized protein C8A04DRAFT_36465 [Dichotomopilus funicola]|uniref:C2H2-type domain-containing protein n=1 Tax=Dichotomopilus funicola TaxID=1934379 RepID=A0AAN6V5G4_9PEZI|nr:hypothetical protein C8A04DRAFT_36465 [Dichotomopilus funicola]